MVVMDGQAASRLVLAVERLVASAVVMVPYLA